MPTDAIYGRTTRVRCDECHSDHSVSVAVNAPRQPSESRWDQLLVEKLHRLGWRAGVEPAAHHQRIPRDVCPECVGRPHGRGH
jgi:hypothetical protein